MAHKTDFFFGQYRCENGQAVLSMDKVCAALKKHPSVQLSADFVTRQFNRFLATHNNHCILEDGTSYPPFWDLIDKINPESIGCIEIYARTDVNEAVEATLACDILIDQGVISVVPNWCAYKVIRADEIVSSLLLPLHLKGLHRKALLRDADGKLKALRQEPSDSGYRDELKLVLDLAKYPNVYQNDECSELFLRHAGDLSIASKLSREGLSGFEAWDRLEKARVEK
ncbi:hypothetical protein [Rheinheimera hassiensis]|uniref:hypothetical protein n=1 Tax=Rheinheimera hassiensis TaxID=1193627 RepID=UPI001F052020|nr:hypothetical protein [Rheinheimera hassiensis]